MKKAGDGQSRSRAPWWHLKVQSAGMICACPEKYTSFEETVSPSQHQIADVMAVNLGCGAAKGSELVVCSEQAAERPRGPTGWLVGGPP